VTNADGVYEFYGLPTGGYIVDIAIPKGLKLYFPIVQGGSGAKGDTTEITLAATSSISVDFVLMADSRLNAYRQGPTG
jgi:hypothetical protein